MRRVPRRVTFRGVTRRAPWTWRPTWTTGAPRTCLTHQVDPIVYDVEAQEPIVLGRFDHLLRLYQHHGLSTVTAEQHGGIAYFEQEWGAICKRRVEWIEYVKRINGTVCRIDFRSALRYGSWESTPRGWVFVVPAEQYTTITL